MPPRIIHMMYFPWDRTQKLKANEHDFDHAPYEIMKQLAPEFEVKLWTYSETRNFCLQQYPEIWEALQQCERPTSMVDVLRWLVVYHVGGIYWQYNCTPMKEMNAYLPSIGKSVRLFTEFVLTEKQRLKMAEEPIRNGEPEEKIRVLNQVFSAYPKNEYIWKTICFFLQRIKTLKVQRDYDILFIAANAAVSTAYDQFGKNDPTIELMDLQTSKRMMKWHYQGSWRTDPQTEPPVGQAVTPSPRIPRTDRIPYWMEKYYRFVKPHPYGIMLKELDRRQPRRSCLPQIIQVFAQMGIRTICEAPSGRFHPMEEKTMNDLSYVGGDPDRHMVAINQKAGLAKNVRFQYMSMLYSTFPNVDLLICPNFLDWIPFSECRRVLRRLWQAQSTYIGITGFSLLNDSWDTALGDFRPINLCLAPFHFPPPHDVIPWKPMADERSDICLMLWKRDAIKKWSGMR